MCLFKYHTFAARRSFTARWPILILTSPGHFCVIFVTPHIQSPIANFQSWRSLLVPFVFVSVTGLICLFVYIACMISPLLCHICVSFLTKERTNTASETMYPQTNNWWHKRPSKIIKVWYMSLILVKVCTNEQEKKEGVTIRQLKCDKGRALSHVAWLRNGCKHLAEEGQNGSFSPKWPGERIKKSVTKERTNTASETMYPQTNNWWHKRPSKIIKVWYMSLILVKVCTNEQEKKEGVTIRQLKTQMRYKKTDPRRWDI